MKENNHKKILALEAEIKKLKRKNAQLQLSINRKTKAPKVKVPKAIKPIFDNAEKVVGEYFKNLKFNPSEGTIEINEERYLLIRASALSYEFLNSFIKLYANRGETEAIAIAKNILFDLAHLLGIEDARNFHKKMQLKDSLNKLSAGPVHFAYSGWAFVEILPESKPSPDENFYLKYNHPFSFEADSWIREKKKAKSPVCIMNSGYSSGWCEESFGFPLTAVEVTCRAQGDKNCTFIMAPPDKIDSYIKVNKRKPFNPPITIPSFLERKKIEEKLNSSLIEKEFLIKEVHHRVKNNLQIISSLLNLQAENIKDLKSKEKYLESIGRIRSMAIIHELLYRSKNLSLINIQNYFSELISFIASTYNLNSRITVKLEVKLKEKFIDLDKAIPCGIIINELLSNAFKYAFPLNKRGQIKITFNQLSDANYRYTLNVSDNGIGIKQKINFQSPKTLGLQLVNSLTEQLEGKLVANTKDGCSFTVFFK